jgi:2-polyprenyl-3-methyl-5-hydroxy-6-metoxy-1,4-benzoquinol methylase/quercetin dioxygenase-like cupin family protein
MVVRDVGDLLAASLRHHLAQGVERFLVFDHQSTDATAAVLESFAELGRLEWGAVEGPFRIERWLNELAREAFLQGADWVLPIDGDEFWIAERGTLAEALARSGAAALEAAVINFVQQNDQLESTPDGLPRMIYRVAEPVSEDARRLVEAGRLPFVAMAYPTKWISRAAAGLRIARGSHRVEGAPGRHERSAEIVCLHAPLRSRAALELRHRPLSDLDPDLAPGESWHLRRWMEMQESAFAAEWDANSASGARLVASGLPLRRDTRLRAAVRPWLGTRGAAESPPLPPIIPTVPARRRAPPGAGSAATAAARARLRRLERLSARRYHDPEPGLGAASTHGQVLSLVGERKRVLELGCATGSMSRLLRERACAVVAVERDAQAAADAAAHCERVLVGDIDDLSILDSLDGDLFDVVVAADVLEHLREPQETLRRLRPLLAAGGYLVASVPNVAHGSVRLALLEGRFPYAATGLLDRDHLRFFTRESLEEMLASGGFLIDHLDRRLVEFEDSSVPFEAASAPAELVAGLRRDVEALTFQFIVRAVPRPGRELGYLGNRLPELVLENERLRRELAGLASSSAPAPAAELDQLRAEVEALRHAAASREAQVEDLRRAAERRAGEVALLLAQLEAISASKTWKLWMASIRLRRALGLAPRPPAPAAPTEAPAAKADAPWRSEFESRGYATIPLFDGAECARILERLRASPPQPREGPKDLAASSRFVYDIATDERLLRAVTAVLGEEVMIWGAAILERRPGEVHPWHTDIETAAAAGGTCSVWIGLENVTRASGLSVVPRSHHFGVPFQEMAARKGKRRGEATDAEVAAWAAELDRRSGTVALDLGVGEALVFDGRLWHGSANTGDTTRTALLLQYATPATPIRTLDPTALEWPFRLLETPWPPCVLVPGSRPQVAVNRFVEPPAPAAAPGGVEPLPVLARAIDLPLDLAPNQAWQANHLFRGSTPNLTALSCHYSVLAPGHSPHPPHRHAEEEILIVLAGEAELVLAHGDGTEEVQRVGRGHYSYYPTHQRHTLRAPPDQTAVYLMFKWTGRQAETEGALETSVIRYDDRFSAAGAGEGGFAARQVCEGPTRYLRRLHSHCSTLTPGGGYAPHADEHDVAIVVVDGTIETIGRRVERNGVVFIPAGESHGMHNPTSAPARYLVFEFHGHPG